MTYTFDAILTLVAILAGAIASVSGFGVGSLLAALIACLPLLIVLETALFLFEPVSAWVMLAYGLYSVFYNIPWSLRLWRLNASGV